MSKIWIGPTGRLTEGHVLDCSKRGVESALKFYDPLLYIKWNPKKLKGWGCWEIRRAPETKSVKDIIEWNGNSFVILDDVENGFINHILDAAFLNYDVVRKIKSMDTWVHYNGGKDFGKELEYKEAKALEKEDKKAMEELKYATKEYKREIKDFMQYVSEGHDPSRIAGYWK